MPKRIKTVKAGIMANMFLEIDFNFASHLMSLKLLATGLYPLLNVLHFSFSSNRARRESLFLFSALYAFLSALCPLRLLFTPLALCSFYPVKFVDHFTGIGEPISLG